MHLLMIAGVCSLSEVQQQMRDSRAEVAGNKAVIAVVEGHLVSALIAEAFLCLHGLQ